MPRGGPGPAARGRAAAGRRGPAAPASFTQSQPVGGPPASPSTNRIARPEGGGANGGRSRGRVGLAGRRAAGAALGARLASPQGPQPPPGRAPRDAPCSRRSSGPSPRPSLSLPAPVQPGARPVRSRRAAASGMVVVTGQGRASRDPDEAMSSSEAEDEFQEPATPTATQAGEALPLLPQQVRAPGFPAPRWARGCGTHSPNSPGFPRVPACPVPFPLIPKSLKPLAA